LPALPPPPPPPPRFFQFHRSNAPTEYRPSFEGKWKIAPPHSRVSSTFHLLSSAQRSHHHSWHSHRTRPIFVMQKKSPPPIMDEMKTPHSTKTSEIKARGRVYVYVFCCKYLHWFANEYMHDISPWHLSLVDTCHAPAATEMDGIKHFFVSLPSSTAWCTDQTLNANT
jgi:hypothetical protein